MKKGKSFKELPQELQSKVIAITGTLPGAGKSFSKRQIVECLKTNQFTVRSLGTTQISSDDMTLCSYLRLYDAKNEVFKKYSEDHKSHPNTKAFIIIDEAWMSNQELVEALRKDFPKCCIILVGDPSQLKGAEQDVTQIYKVDRNIILEGSHRTNDERLTNFLNTLKNGEINFDLLKTRIRDPHKDDLFITFLKSERDNYNNIVRPNAMQEVGGYVYSMKCVMCGNKPLFYKEDDEWTKSWKNMQLWRVITYNNWGVNLESITDDKSISNLPLDIYYKYFHNASSVNINKIQGVTFKDTNISIRPWKGLMSNVDVLRQLYVMCSRVSSWDQISIHQEAYDKLYASFKKVIAPLSYDLDCESSITLNSNEFKNISKDKLFKLLLGQYAPRGGCTSSSSNCNNICAITRGGCTSTFNGPHSTALSCTTLPGGGIRYDNLTKGQRQSIRKYVDKYGEVNPAWNEEKKAYGEMILNKAALLKEELPMKYTTELLHKYKMPVCRDIRAPSSATVHDDDQFIITAEYLNDTTEFDKKGEHMRPVCFVYESDDLSKQEQLDMAMNLPKTYVFSITDSGSKSIHTLIYIDEKWRDEAKANFKYYWRKVGEKLFGDKMKYMDKNCASVARLSRLPGGRRDNGNEQKCYFLNRNPIGICLDEFMGEITRIEEEKARKEAQDKKRYEHMKERLEITDVNKTFKNMCTKKNSDSSLLALEIYESCTVASGANMIGAVSYAKGLARHYPEMEVIARQIYEICHKQHPSNMRKRYEEI